MRFTTLLLFAMALDAGPSPGLPQEREMQPFVDQVLTMTGLHNKVDVVIDWTAKGCAYATTIDGQQLIGVDPACVGPLRGKNGAYNWRTIGILTHEIGHLLSGHTTDGVGSRPPTEAYADEWSGWAMYRLGATLKQAQACASSMNEKGSDTHPGRSVRTKAVEQGRKNARHGRMRLRSKPFPEWWGELMKEPLPWVR